MRLRWAVPPPLIGACALAALLLRSSSGDRAVLTVPLRYPPAGLLIDGSAGRVFVWSGDGHLLVLDSHSGALLRSLDLGVAAAPPLLDEGAGRLYVASGGGGGRLVVVDARSGRAVRTYQMPEPSALALDRRRHLLIVASGSTAQLRILDSVSGRPRTLLPLDAPPVAVGVDERRDRTVVLERSAFGRDGFVALLATSTGRVLASYTVALNADSLAIDSLHGYAWFEGSAVGGDAVSLLDTRTGTLGRGVRAGFGPYSLAMDEATGYAYVASGSSNSLILIPGANGGIRTVPGGQNPLGVSVLPGSGRVLAQDQPLGSGAMTVIDGRSGATLRTVSFTGSLMALSGAPQSGLALALLRPDNVVDATSGPGTLEAIELATGGIVHSYVVGANPFAMALDLRAGRVFVLSAGGVERAPERWSWLPWPLRERLLSISPGPPTGQAYPPSLSIVALAR